MSEIISYEEAVKLLPDGEYIHTFDNPVAGVLAGVDWDRNDILEAMQCHEISLAGEQAQAMNHGIAIKMGDDWLFIETRKADA